MEFKYLNRRTNTDKALRDKAFIIAENPKCDGYQHSRASMVYFDKKILVALLKMRIFQTSN